MAATKITVRNDGSMKVEGDFEIVDQEGKVFGLAVGTRSLFAAAGTPRTSPSATVPTRK